MSTLDNLIALRNKFEEMGAGNYNFNMFHGDSEERPEGFPDCGCVLDKGAFLWPDVVVGKGMDEVVGLCLVANKCGYAGSGAFYIAMHKHDTDRTKRYGQWNDSFDTVLVALDEEIAKRKVGET